MDEFISCDTCCGNERDTNPLMRSSMRKSITAHTMRESSISLLSEGSQCENE